MQWDGSIVPGAVSEVMMVNIPSYFPFSPSESLPNIFGATFHHVKLSAVARTTKAPTRAIRPPRDDVTWLSLKEPTLGFSWGLLRLFCFGSSVVKLEHVGMGRQWCRGQGFVCDCTSERHGVDKYLVRTSMAEDRTGGQKRNIVWITSQGI